MMDKGIYEEIKLKLSEKNAEAEDVRRLSEDYTSIILEYYIQSRSSQVKRTIQYGKRLRVLLDKVVKKDLSYYAGSLAMAIKIFELLIQRSEKQEEFSKRMNALYDKSGVRDILIYLYKNPDSQHKVLCENTVKSKSYLSQLLRELEEVGCVERYATGKRSFFSLSIAGQAFLNEKRRIKRDYICSIANGKDSLYNIRNKNMISINMVGEKKVKYNECIKARKIGE